jgi:hypothetical protein
VSSGLRWWTTALVVMSASSGCYESHEAPRLGVDAGDDVPPSLCPFPDDAVVVIDDTPGCRFVTLSPAHGPNLCPSLERGGLAALPVRASVRIVHEGRRDYRVEHRYRPPPVPGDPGIAAYFLLFGDPRYRPRDRSAACQCDHFGFITTGGDGLSSTFWRGENRRHGTETQVLLGTALPEAMVDIAVCVDTHPYDAERPSLAP